MPNIGVPELIIIAILFVIWWLPVYIAYKKGYGWLTLLVLLILGAVITPVPPLLWAIFVKPAILRDFEAQ
jgi:hypothetical protein